MASNPIITGQQRVAWRLVSFLLVGFFVVVLVAAGDGAGPVGLLLVAGKFSVWGFSMLLGWGGILLTLTSLFGSRTKLPIGEAALGLGCVAASWFLFFLASEEKGGTLVTSVPVFVLSAIRAVQLWRWRRAGRV